MDKHPKSADCPTTTLEPHDSQKGSVAADSLSREGAMALARRLQEFWHGRDTPPPVFGPNR
jgi:hypothetical protein